MYKQFETDSKGFIKNFNGIEVGDIVIINDHPECLISLIATEVTEYVVGFDYFKKDMPPFNWRFIVEKYTAKHINVAFSPCKFKNTTAELLNKEEIILLAGKIREEVHSWDDEKNVLFKLPYDDLRIIDDILSKHKNNN